MSNLNKSTQTINMPKSKNAKKRQRQNSRKMLMASNEIPAMNDRGLAMVQPLPMGRKKPFREAGDLTMIPKVSSAGASFLKAAFAPVDFDGIDLRGIPDSYEGKSLVKKHKFTNTKTLTASNDYYIILAPVPGTAYFANSVAAGTPITSSSVFTGYDYSDTVTLFGPAPPNAANTFTRFRFISNHVEIVPTVNETTWTGSITVFKTKLQINQRGSIVSGSGVNNLFNISGLEDTNSTLVQNYAAPFRDGAFTGAFSIGPSMDFTPIVEGYASVPAQILAPSDFGQLACATAFPGLDNNFETVIIRIQGVGTNALDSFIIRTWACVEYSVLASSALYEYTSASPRDDLAMSYYRQVIKNLPVAVAYYDNANFWSRVLDIIRKVVGVMRLVPGPIGGIASGVDLISSGISSLIT